jgi:hypothetical protein
MGSMRRVLLPFLLAALACALTACGSSVKSSVKETIDPVADAATKSEQAGGFKTTMSVTLAAAGKQFTMRAHGAFSPREGEMEMDLSELLGQAGAPPGTDGSMKAVYVTENGDPIMYLKLGFLSTMIPGGKPWVKLDLAKAGKAAGIDLSQLMGGASQNPADSLALLRSEGDFTEVGTETLGGVETTHYNGTIDLTKAAAARGVSADVIKRLEGVGAPSVFPADVWVDKSGYVRRFETSYDQTIDGSPMSMKMRMDLSDYGTSVDVSPPPAADVFDATELASQGVASALNNNGTGG